MADSADEYRRVRRFRLKMGFEPPKDRAAYRAEYLARSARPEVRAQYVLITDSGRLTVAHGRKLTGRKNEKSVVNKMPARGETRPSLAHHPITRAGGGEQ
jgi:hypothetical protein